MDPVTLGMAKADAAKTYTAKSHTNVATRILAGRMGVRNVAVGATDQLTLETQAEFSAVRLIFGNASKALSDRVISVAASVGGDASDLNNSAGAWVVGAKDGAPAFATDLASAANHTAYTVTDWITLSSVPRTDGGTKPLLYVRARFGGNGAMSVAGDGTDNFTNWATRDGHRWAWRTQTVDAIGDPTAFTSTTNISQSPIVGVQYLANGRVITVGGVGDSITEGRGTYVGEGFILPACDQLAAETGVPIEYANFGWSGQSSGNFNSRGLWMLESPVRPDVLVSPNGSPNDYSVGAAPVTDAGVAAARRSSAALIAATRARQVAHVLWTWLPTNTSVHDYGASDSKRVAYNTATLASAPVLVADTATAVSGVTTGGQVQMTATSTSDNVHPDDSGNVDLTTVLLPKLRLAVRSIAPGKAHTATPRSAMPNHTVTYPTVGLHGGGFWTIATTSGAVTATVAEIAPAGIPSQGSDLYFLHVRPTAKATTVNRTNADVFLINGTAVTTFTLQPGESAIMRHDGTGWAVLKIPAVAVRRLVSVISAVGATQLTQEAEVYVCTAASGTPGWTLPLVADATGRSIVVKNRGAVSLTVFRNGSDSIYDTATVNSIAVAAGGVLRLVCDGTYWSVI